MTTPLPSENPAPDPGSRHLRLVPEHPPGDPAAGAAGPLVGYVVFVPEGTDPARLFVPDGPRPVIHPLTPVPAAADPDPAEPDGEIRVDAVRRVARIDGRVLDLTYLEFELLAHLVAHPDQVLSRESLIGSVWGYGHIGDGRTVDVHIARVRAKLGRAHRHRIVTVRRVGYKYTPGRPGCSGPASRGQS
ncbi:winged helix-turn-helix domain-containing protein [Streptomyces sp. NPDC023723]|uniref:winged helix-turn-helix domain-containing protein n=1 Tax=Streptomyces sp. NPDC023723 TaxID=3154323 RepID=UPI0033CF16F0